MHQNDFQEPTTHDDTRVLRYLLHTIKGISPVSGGVMGDALEEEYEKDEGLQFEPGLDSELDFVE